ncbi:MAG: sulfatase-like hydrolase/transferase [Bacteroidia bacterium]|nr:sulfatase-like hydrolase/transferase [Bacteroidia bacterium]
MNFVRGQLSVLIKRLLVLFLIYFLLRIAFLLIYYPSFRFGNFTGVIMAFITSLRFDTSAIILSNAPFIILSLLPFAFFYHKMYQWMLLIVYTVINTFFVFANCVDFIFFRFVRKRMTADIFDFIALGDDTKNVFPSLLRDYWFIIPVCLLMVWLMLYLYTRIRIQSPTKINGNKSQWMYALSGTLIMILCTGAAVIGARGGIQYKPLRMIAAARTTAVENIPLVASTTFSMLSTIGKEKLEEINYFPEKELSKYFYCVHQNDTAQPMQPLNVVLILLESFSKEYIGYYNDDKRFTPFFDSLITQSVSFPHAFANSKKSIEGIPAVIASLPALMEEPFITSPYNGGKINSMASELKKNGYYSAFFHGGNNGTMGFDNFAFAAGYDDYFGRNEYGQQDYDGHWGVFDHKFYRWFAERMNGMKQPFFTTFFTISSHHPFKIPDELKGKFPKGDHPILESIAYADFALRTFFEFAQNQPWYSNTLFVITADHTGPSFSTQYETRKGIYEIPLLFFMPGKLQPKEDFSVAQQCDVMPTVLGFLNVKQPFVAFGNNLFNASSKRFAASFLQDTYQLISDNYLIQFDETQLLNAYRWREDDLLLKNEFTGDETPFRNELNTLKAIIQQYNHRVLNNRLAVTP